MRLFAFGFSYSARALMRRLEGWTAAATYRDAAGAASLAAAGVSGISVEDHDGLVRELARAQAILLSASPGPGGCPALPVLVPALAQANAFPDWIGYLSTTGVYGDRNGGWVKEESRLAAQSVEGARRMAAERDWLEVGRGMGLTITVHRLPGIYGPGRSSLDRVRAGAARRLKAQGQVFSRIHVDDLATGLAASIARPRAGGIYNLCDDEPASNSDVVAEAARLLGVPPPPEQPLDLEALSPQARRFYAESKRVSNARAKAELDWRPAYPTYREGLAAILAAGG